MWCMAFLYSPGAGNCFFAQQGLLTTPLELEEQEKDKIETQGTMSGLYKKQKTEDYHH